jgi:hypothetical protein
VPNPSFEINNQCPVNFADLTSVESWYKLPGHQGSPDYFHACGSSLLSVPNNIKGFQPAFNGDAYLGITTYMANPPELREYIQTNLTSPMIAGHSYLVSFYVNLADNCVFSSNNIGAIFTVSPLTGPGLAALNIIPNLSYPIPISDTTGWTLISGTYTASGNEQYLSIGNFYNNSSTQAVTINQFGASAAAYYFIDQVSVVELPLATSDFLQQKYQIVPNPVSDKFTIVSNQNDSIINIELYSTYNKVRSFKPNESVYHIENLASGIYYLILTFESNKKSVHKIIKL